MPAIRTTLTIALSLISAAAASAADEFPYSAYVAVDQAEVVAGPGHRYYATARLARGTPIEIYREETSGWLAIRPPEGSFSWIPAIAVERLKDDPSVGRVKEPTAAWIGTAAEHVSEHRQLIELKAGEMVQVLGEKSIGESGDPQKWLKISPPAGEFRWIHLRDVSRQMPEEEPALEEPPKVERETREPNFSSTASRTPREQSLRDQPEEPRRFEVGERAIALQEIEQPNSIRRIDRQVAPQFQAATGGKTPTLSADGFVPRKRRSGEAVQPVATAAAPNFRAMASGQPQRPQPEASARIAAAQPTPRMPPATSAALATSNVGISSEQLRQQLEQLEVDLSLMLAQDRSLWNLAPLRERVQQLVDQGADPTARGDARLLLEKIKQFEAAFNVQDFGPITGGIAGTPATAGTPSATAPPASQPSAQSAALADPRYDAQGWLKPVVSRKSDKPAAPYAVVDQEGQPLCFVTPSPGLNLNRYLNKQVGVYGRRGMHEELKKPHVTAERVIDLDRQWR